MYIQSLIISQTILPTVRLLFITLCHHGATFIVGWHHYIGECIVSIGELAQLFGPVVEMNLILLIGLSGQVLGLPESFQQLPFPPFMCYILQT
jgi:hypothetical protein